MTLLEVASEMPWTFYTLIAAIIIAVSFALWVTLSGRLGTLDQQFYDLWTKRIDAELRRCRKIPRKGGKRMEAHRETFDRLYNELTEITGGPSQFNTFGTGTKSVWIHLLTRFRDVQYFDRFD